MLGSSALIWPEVAREWEAAQVHESLRTWIGLQCDVEEALELSDVR